MTCGIYILVFEGTDKVYIGQSKNVETRYNSHIFMFRNNRAASKLQEAYNLYGTPTMSILEVCSSEELNKNETFYIKEFDSIENGFNSLAGGAINSGLTGDKHGRSKYSNKQILEAIDLLIKYPNISYEILGEACGVSYSMLRHIAAGENHTWVGIEYPDIYKELMKLKGNRPRRKL